MQFDKTRIAIRKRNWPEILDFALHVCRNQAAGLLASLLVGIVPLALFNHWLLSGLTQGVDYQYEWPWAYIWLTLLLAMLELPLATSIATLYLGQVLFVEKAEPRKIARDFTASLPQLLLFQVLLRLLVAVPVLSWILPYSMWPFANEIILLERNPLRAKRKGDLTTRRRIRALHADLGGELFVRSVACLALGVLLMIALVWSGWYAVLLISGRSELGWWVFVIGLPAATWTVVGFFVVVRFLSYLDLRIRREGWDVDLCLRAQRTRLARQFGT